jgi:hypothetical protein
MGGELAFSAIEGVSEADASPAPDKLPPGVAPEDGRSGGDHQYGIQAPHYALPDSFYDARKVSCSACDWYLEDAEWCCDNDCNQAGPHYRQAYVCKDPSDTSGRLTASCNQDTACRRSELPTRCSAERLAEMRQLDTRNDAACVKRA